MGNRSTAAFGLVMAAVCDPLNPTGYYLCDHTSIRYFDESKDEVTLVAGRGALDPELTDGIGAAAGFHSLTDLLITSDGRTIWCEQSLGPIRRVDTSTREVTSHWEQQRKVFSLCWDRASTAKPDSAFYGLIMANNKGQITRFDTCDGHQRACPTDEFDVCSVLCVPTGHILFSHSDEYMTYSLYSFDPLTSDIQRLDFIEPTSAIYYVLVDSTRTLITTSHEQLITYTLPPQYFLLPKCCDRDL